MNKQHSRKLIKRFADPQKCEGNPIRLLVQSCAECTGLNNKQILPSYGAKLVILEDFNV